MVMNQRLLLIFLPVIFVCTAISSSITAYAQTAPSGLELSPTISNPIPGQSVTITARSYNIDINSSNLTWTSGGKTLLKGIGANELTVTAPALGKTITISVAAVSS